MARHYEYEYLVVRIKTPKWDWLRPNISSRARMHPNITNLDEINARNQLETKFKKAKLVFITLRMLLPNTMSPRDISFFPFWIRNLSFGTIFRTNSREKRIGQNMNPFINAPEVCHLKIQNIRFNGVFKNCEWV